MSASAVFILDLKGKPLISRNYKGDVSAGDIEAFMALLLQREEEGGAEPLLAQGALHFLWIKHANLYLVAVTRKNGNAALVFAFLYKVVEVFCEYFKELEEESVRDNFVLIYELLDELMDFGFPQTTDSKILQEYITQEGNKLDTGRSRVPATVTNAVSWRSEGIRYKKNEVFIDVVESVNLLVSASGSVLLSEVLGSIRLKVFLSGMPELRLGLNDRVLLELTGRGTGRSVELEDVKFHQCVRLARFERERSIAFVPPDGTFELMAYRLGTPVKPLIWIESVIEKFSHSRLEILVKAKGQFKKQSVATGVEIAVPVPSDADSPKFRASAGSARYLPERNVVLWSIKSFPGGREHELRARLGLPSVRRHEDEGRPPIAVRFEIPYFTVSGIQVRRGALPGPAWPLGSLGFLCMSPGVPWGPLRVPCGPLCVPWDPLGSSAVPWDPLQAPVCPLRSSACPLWSPGVPCVSPGVPCMSPGALACNLRSPICHLRVPFSPLHVPWGHFRSPACHMGLLHPAVFPMCPLGPLGPSHVPVCSLPPCVPHSPCVLASLTSPGVPCASPTSQCPSPCTYVPLRLCVPPCPCVPVPLGPPTSQHPVPWAPYPLPWGSQSPAVFPLHRRVPGCPRGVRGGGGGVPAVPSARWPCPGPVHEDHGEERLPGAALGALRDAERR